MSDEPQATIGVGQAVGDPENDIARARPAIIKHADTPVSGALQAVKSEYDGKAPALDLVIERFKEMYGDAAFLKLQWRDEPVYWLPNDIMTTHPAFKAWMELQKLMHNTMKELLVAARMEDLLNEEKVDDVDTFLENMQRVNRPHRSVNRASD